MHSGALVFAQLMEFLPRHEFNACVRRYGGERRHRGFSCRDQFLCMAFAQLTFRESLRDIVTCLWAVESKLYHAGFRSSISRSTLADANRVHDWRIYADLAQVLIRRSYCQKLLMAEYQAAAVWGFTPSMNGTPAITSGKSWQPLRRRHFLEADCISL